MGQPFAGFEAGVATILGRASVQVGTSHFSYLSLVYSYSAVGLFPTNCVLNGDTKKRPRSRMNREIFGVFCFVDEKNVLAAHGASHITQLSPPLHAFRAHKVTTRANAFVCKLKAHSTFHFLVWYILLSHYPTILANWT